MSYRILDVLRQDLAAHPSKKEFRLTGKQLLHNAKIKYNARWRKAAKETACRIAGRVGGKYSSIRGDIFRSAILYGTTPAEYERFHFYEMPPHRRQTYFTDAGNDLLIQKYNTAAQGLALFNASAFRLRYSVYMNQENEQSVIHPELLSLAGNADIRLCVFTLRDGDCISIPYVGMRIISPDGFSLYVRISPFTGIAAYPASDEWGTAFEAHPATGQRIVGFSVPNWEETVSIVRALAQKEAGAGYIMWELQPLQQRTILTGVTFHPSIGHWQLPPLLGQRGLMKELAPFLSR